MSCPTNGQLIIKIPDRKRQSIYPQRCPGGKGGIFTSKSTTQTDILLFMSDQHSYALGGYAKDPLARTPWMDTLAQNGTAMSQAITSCPLCAPARMSMLTGQYASRIGVMDNAST